MKGDKKKRTPGKASAPKKQTIVSARFNFNAKQEASENSSAAAAGKSDVVYQKTDYTICDEDKDTDFEQTPDSQIFDCLSSDSDNGTTNTGLDIISA